MRIKTAAMTCAVMLAFIPALLRAEDPEPKESGRVEKIVITAKKDTPGDAAPSAQITVISKDEIKASGSIGLAQIISPALGIQIQRHGGAGEPSFVSIRGSSPEQVLVLINGKRLNSAQGGGVDLTAVDIGSIERIEIFRGGNSSIFGADSIGGTVNIITEKPESEGFGGDAYVSAGSYNTYTAGANLRGRSPDKRFAYRLGLGGLYTSGEYTYLDDHAASDSAVRENADARKINYSAGLETSPSGNAKITAEFRGFVNEKGVPGILEFPTNTARIAEQRHSGNIRIDAGTGLGDFSLDILLSRHMRRYTDPGYYLGSIDDTHVNDAAAADLGTSNTLEPGSAVIDYSFGYSFRIDRLDSTALIQDDGISEGNGTVTRLRSSFSAAAGIGPQENAGFRFIPVLHPSLRYDIQSVDGTAAGKRRQFLSYNIGGVLPVLEKDRLVVKGNYGLSCRTPSFNDLFWPSTSFAVGNSGLRPEEAVIWDAGVKWKPTKAVSAELVYFSHSVDGLIVWTPGAGGRWRPDNLGLAVIRGVEAETKYLFEVSPVDSFGEATFNICLMDPVDRTKDSAAYGKVLPRRARVAANGIISLSHINGHTLRIEGRYIGDRFATAQNTKVIDGYFILDGTAVWQVNPTWKLSFCAKNILNRSYVDQREYPVPGMELRIEAGVEF